MTFNPHDEPCWGCGNEPDECVCPPDLPDDPIEELDTDYLSWGWYELNPENEEEPEDEDGR